MSNYNTKISVSRNLKLKCGKCSGVIEAKLVMQLESFNGDPICLNCLTGMVPTPFDLTQSLIALYRPEDLQGMDLQGDIMALLYKDKEAPFESVGVQYDRVMSNFKRRLETSLGNWQCQLGGELVNRGAVFEDDNNLGTQIQAFLSSGLEEMKTTMLVGQIGHPERGFWCYASLRSLHEGLIRVSMSMVGLYHNDREKIRLSMENNTKARGTKTLTVEFLKTLPESILHGLNRQQLLYDLMELMPAGDDDHHHLLVSNEFQRRINDSNWHGYYNTLRTFECKSWFVDGPDRNPDQLDLAGAMMMLKAEVEKMEKVNGIYGLMCFSPKETRKCGDDQALVAWVFYY